MKNLKNYLDDNRYCLYISVFVVSFQLISIFLLNIFTHIFSINTTHTNNLYRMFNLYVFQTTLFGFMLFIELSHVWFVKSEKKCTIILNLSILSNSFIFYLSCTTKLLDVFLSFYGREILPIRFIYWMSTCSIMILVLFKFTSFNDNYIYKQLLNTILMILTGFFATLFNNVFGSCMICISYFTGYVTINNLYYMMVCCEKTSNDITSKKVFIFLKYFVILSWSLFPIIWIISFNNYISDDTENMLYMLSDSISKLMFISSVQNCKSETINVELENQLEKLRVVSSKQKEEYEISQQLLNNKMKKEQEMLVGFLLNSLGNPLSAISMCVDQIKKQTDNNLETFETLKSSVKSTLKIVDDVLNIQKLDSGVFKISLSAFSINHTVQTLINQFKSVNPDFEFDLNIDENIPIVLGDSYRLTQLLSILIQNSIDYSCKVKQTHILVEEFNFVTKLNSETDKRQTRVKFIVIDYGCGIDDIDKPKIFTPFCHIESKNKRIYRTGLSLSLASKLVHRMNGSIGFDSNLDCGSTFTMEFPFEISNIQDIHYDSESNPESQNNYMKKTNNHMSTPSSDIRNLVTNTTKNKKILLVDDDNIILKLFKKNINFICENLKITSEIDCAKTCNDAIAFCKKSNYDLIILDYYLYGKETGIDFLISYNLLFESSNTIVIGVTSNSEETIVEKYLKNGAKYVFSKPISRKDLSKIIEELK